MTNEYTTQDLRSGPSRGDLFVTAFFVLFFVIQLIHHAMWRDEVNVWGLVVASPTFASLVSNAHYEGHTLLWYLLLWIPSHFTHSQATLKVLEGIIGCAIYYTLGFFSPFSRFEKILIFLSYFIIFEYTVMARMYGLCLLIMLVFLYWRCRFPERYVANLTLLGLLAIVDAIGVMLSLALLVEYAWSTYSAWNSTPASRRKARWALLLYLSMVGLALWSGLPSRDVSYTSAIPLGKYAYDMSHLAVSINNAIVVPWIPLPHGFVHGSYWGDIDVELQLIVLAPIVLYAYYVIFRLQSSLLLMLGFTLLESITFLHLVYLGRVRHVGIIFLAFLAALWIQRWRQPSISDPAKILLGLSAISGIIISMMVWVRPFSMTPQAGDWLRKNHLENAALVGTWDFSVASIAEELRRPIYFLDCNCSGTFLLFSNRRDSFRWEQIPERLALAKKKLAVSELIFVCSNQLTTEQKTLIAKLHLHVQGLAAITGAGVPGEDYFIYKVT